MTLRFILGPAGSGKTYTCISQMAQLIAADPLGYPLLLLTPQQSTFIYEKSLAAAGQRLCPSGPKSPAPRGRSAAARSERGGPAAGHELRRGPKRG